MALKTIHLNGFKSFATDTKIHLYNPVTAIVGPNGSGKSNVADAIRFALGEQSIKSMRGGKGEDLIFNGSHKVSRKNRAHVSLIFDNSKRIFDLDTTEVELQRLVHRDGVNEYLVNNAKTRLKDKLELIASANIGATGHHLITQGEADKFVTATDPERRMLIEDALGLNLYKLRRKEANQKLSRTQEKLQQVSKLIWEIEPVVKALSAEVDTLQSLKDKEKTLVALYAEMFFLWDKWLSAEDLRLHSLNQDLETGSEKLRKEITDLADQASENDQLTNEEIQLGVKKQELNESLAEQQEKLQQVNTEIGQIDGQIQQLQIQIDKIKRKISIADRSSHISAVSVSIDDVEQLHESIQSAQSLLEAKQADDSFYRKCLGHNNSRVQQSAEGDLHSEVSDLETQVADFQQKQNEKDIKSRSIRNTITQLQQDIQKTETAIREASSDRIQLIKQLEQKRAQLADHQEKIELTSDQLIDLQTERDNYNKKKHVVSSLYGRSILEVPAVPLVAGESIFQRLGETKRQVLRLEAQLEDADISALSSLRSDLEVDAARLNHLHSERDDVERTLAKTKALIGDLTNQIEIKLEVGLAEINKNTERFFRVLFGGGSCVLRSTQDNDRRGIAIDLQLPYKRVKSIQALSGGERSLASLAILFAITLLSPPPFVVLDETDAALDEANSRRYAKLIRELSEHTQLILITHNRETMTFADELYGVTMGSDGVSRLLSVTLKDVDQV